MTYHQRERFIAEDYVPSENFQVASFPSSREGRYDRGKDCIAAKKKEIINFKGPFEIMLENN